MTGTTTELVRELNECFPQATSIYVDRDADWYRVELEGVGPDHRSFWVAWAGPIFGWLRV